MSRRLAVLGHPVGHSRSPAMHGAALAELGLDGEWSYEAIDVDPGGFEARARAMPEEGFVGANVTIPHKQAVFDLVDAVSEEASLIGAVNTVVCEPGGRLSGHNTDAAGFLRALTESAGYDPAGQGAVLLGAGGAALAVAVGLQRAGASRLWIANRTDARAEEMVSSLRRHFSAARLRATLLSGDALREPVREASLLVNCTSVGMRHGPDPQGMPLPEPAGGLLGPHLLVYDLVYNPARTPLLRAAEAAGARTQEGLPMLIYQGALAFERWTGRPAPVEVMMAHGRIALAGQPSPER